MHTGRRKLLLADDSPTIRKVVSLTFEDEGFEVVAVADGAEATRALEDGPAPDVLLADVCMPGPDGYELCERVKRDERLGGVPVVLLVGTFEPFNEAEARRVGADTFLTKPFQSIRDLVSKVGSLLGGGGSAAEPKDEAAHAARLTEAAPADVPTRAAEDGDAPHGAHSFADFGADDELIEARPAESFNAAAPDSPPARRRRTDDPAADDFDLAASDASTSASGGARPFVESKDPDFFDSHFASNGDAAHEPPAFGVGGSAAEVLALEDEDDEEEMGAGTSPDVLTGLTKDDFTAPTDVFTTTTRESVMHEQTPAQTSPDANDTHAAHAADTNAAALDDTLLDLGQVDAPAVAATSAGDDDDDFILDLGFDDEPARPSTPRAVAAPQVGVAAGTDAASAFAEAAHGERQPSFAGSASSSSSFAQAERVSSAVAESDEAPWRDVVVQDGPRGFVFGAEDEAPAGSVEPEVVPAEEPVPATAEGEFTEGSVEGDRPKPPTGQSATPFVAEGHTRVEEPPRADQLSREAVDAIARRVVELMSDKVVREIAWEVVPELAELLIKQKLEEDRRS